MKRLLPFQTWDASVLCSGSLTKVSFQLVSFLLTYRDFTFYYTHSSQTA